MLRTFHSAPLLAFAVGILVGTPTTSAAGSSPSCVQARAEARYLGFAYDHWVHVHNACEKPVACTVSTNVNPDPIDFDVPAAETRSVLTFRANTSSQFTYDLSCSLTE
jgi:hypothetical protein